MRVKEDVMKTMKMVHEEAQEEDVCSEREKKSQNPQKVNIVHNFKYAWKIYAYYVKS